jgi:hypothetical protein
VLPGAMGGLLSQAESEGAVNVAVETKEGSNEGNVWSPSVEQSSRRTLSV